MYSRKVLKRYMRSLSKEVRTAVWEYLYRQEHKLPWDNRPAYGVGRFYVEMLRRLGIIE